MAKKTLLIVGLGNPGEKYAHTRHNVGFEVMSRLEGYYGVKLRRKFLLQGQTAEITDGETKVVLCEPLTYMNKSGECIRKLLNRFKVPQEQMIVIFDDIDLPPGKVRVRKNGRRSRNAQRDAEHCRMPGEDGLSADPRGNRGPARGGEPGGLGAGEAHGGRKREDGSRVRQGGGSCPRMDQGRY